MFELMILSFLLGTLGLEVMLFGRLMKIYQTNIERRLCEEEEVLNPDEPTQTAFDNTSIQSHRQNEWEYKIVRANRDLFRNPAVFQRLCKEEASVGWILLEKLDNRRVRFKRSISIREQPSSQLPVFDPYRCDYGSASNWTFWLAAIACTSAMILPAYLAYTFVFRQLNQQSIPRIPSQQQLLQSIPQEEQ
ncbi:MAG: hypothetical protein WBA13_07545 [Microcoleaceae cyanobacterium]